MEVYAQDVAAKYSDIKYESALKNIENMQFNKAIEDLILFRSKSFAKNHIESLKLLSDCYWKVRKYEEAKRCYDTLIQLNNLYTTEEKFHISELFAMSGNYPRAAEYLNGIKGFENKLKGYLDIIPFLKDSLNFQLMLGSQQSDTLIFPFIIKDSLLWLSQKDITSAPKGSVIAKYFSKNENRLFNQLVDSVDTETDKISIFSNPATYSFSPVTGNIYFTLFQDFFTKKKKTNVQHYFRIAESKITGSKTSEISLFSLGDGYYSMLQPVISPDGNLLVFISNINKNQFDLFYCKRNSNTNSWSFPAALTTINTIGDEVFPSFGSDGCLYFSSNGRPGLGGLDIYKVFLKLSGGDDVVTHLSYPINSRHDDYGFQLLKLFKKGFTASFTSKRTGNDIIYQVDYKKNDVKMKGSVISEISGDPIPFVKTFLLKQNENNQWIRFDSTSTDELGLFSFDVTPNSQFKINFSNAYNDLKLDISIIENPYIEILQSIPLKDFYSEMLTGKKRRATVDNPISLSLLNNSKQSKEVSNKILLPLNSIDIHPNQNFSNGEISKTNNVSMGHEKLEINNFIEQFYKHKRVDPKLLVTEPTINYNKARYNSHLQKIIPRSVVYSLLYNQLHNASISTGSVSSVEEAVRSANLSVTKTKLSLVNTDNNNSKSSFALLDTTKGKEFNRTNEIKTHQSINDIGASNSVNTSNGNAKLISKSELDRIADLTSRIELSSINIYTESDSVKIELYDNGKFDNDTISVLLNNRIVVNKQEIQTDIKKPVIFSFNIDKEQTKNRISIVADNLGLEPPNSALIIITDFIKKPSYYYISTDLKHNAVFNFYKISKKIIR